jgi:anaerobic selenocysteine-containing dehydrogenase
MPDARKALKALTSLELLVTIDTRMSETAEIADYVIAPTMSYERADHTFNLEPYFARPYAMATAPIVAPPPGVIEDWQFFWLLGQFMGKQLTLAGQALDMDEMPRSADLLAMLAANGRISLEEVAAAPHGYPAAPRTTRVGPPREEARDNRLELLPDDVLDELQVMFAQAVEPEHGEMRLVVRRMREIMNSLGREIDRLPRQPFNPAFMHPSEMRRLGLTEDAPVRISTDHGSVLAQARADKTVRPGVIAMTHCWTTVPAGEDRADNVNLLTGNDAATQSINLMPRLTSLVVRVEARA